MTRKLALFDLDHTLLPLDSDYSWGEFTVALGWHGADAFKARNDAFFADYQAGCLDIHEYVRFATQAFVQRGRAVAMAAHNRFMTEVIGPAIRPEALALLRGHQDAGDEVVIVTATNEFVTAPIARALGVDQLIAVELGRDPEGWFTTEIQGTPSMREGKVVRVSAWLEHHGWTWEQVETTFYSDSMNDVPLLERVDHPVATNPDPKLRALAQARSWRILDLFAKTP